MLQINIIITLINIFPENKKNATLQRSENRTLRISEDQCLKLDDIPIMIEGTYTYNGNTKYV